MAAINVNRENPDQFYRYKMPSLIAKVEGKGNGIKTVIVNMVEIGKALGRPASYPCKYFGCELGAQTQMDTKIGRYIVNGAHESEKLQDLLDGFIKKFVLCPECDNPETVLRVQSSKGRIGQSCRACGYQGMVDLRHKLTTFILKNPPNAGDDSSGKKDKRARRAEKQKGKAKKEEPEPSTPTSPGHEQPAEDDGFIEAPSVQNGGHTGDDDWSADTSEAAVKARTDDLTGLVSTLTLHNDLEKSGAQRVDMFYKYVEGLKNSGGIPAVTSALPKIKAEAEKLDVMDKAAGILAELLYTEKLVTQIKEYRTIMLPFVVENRKAQKYVLIGFEKLVGEVHPTLMSKVVHILKAFYDNDILEEEAILEWADKASKRHVREDIAKLIHEKAAPFVTWLRTAEEESSDDEEEEDEVEVVYSERASGSITTETPQANTTEQEAADDGIDIDAI